MSATDLLTLITEGILILLSVITIRDFLRHRNAIRRDIALMFGALATPLYILLLATLIPTLSVVVLTILGVVAYFTLLAQPFLMLNLLRYFHPVPARVMQIAGIAMLLSWGGIIRLSFGPLPILTQAIVVYFAVVDGYAMISFIRAARSSWGVTRQRLIFAAIGAALLSVLMILSGVQILFPTMQLVSRTLSAVLGVIAALAFYVAFAPPRFLSRVWRFAEFQQFLLLSSDTYSAETSEAEEFENLCRAALRTTGGFAAAVLQRHEADGTWQVRTATDAPPFALMLKDGESVFERVWQQGKAVWFHRTKAQADQWHLLTAANAGVCLLVPVTSGAKPWGLLCVLHRYRTLFVEEDLRILMLLAQHSAIRRDNASLVVQLQDYSRELEATVEARTLALRKSEEGYRQIIETAQEGIWVVDSEGKTTLVNPRLAALLGYSVSEMIGTPFAQHIAGDADELPIGVNGGQGAPAVVRPRELTLRRKDGSTLWTQLSASSLPDASGQPASTLVMVMDISERKRAEAEILQLNAELEDRVRERTAQLNAAMKELEAFSYSVSHDLRAPLRAMDGFSRILLEDYTDSLDEEGQRVLGRIIEASEQMGQLIDGLLQLSRLSRSQLKREPVNLSEIARSVAERLQEGEPQRQVTFSIDDKLVVSGDRRMLQIVLDNLLGNAWKYTRHKPDARIEFGVTEHDGQRAFFVRDNGVGFNMAYSHKLFGAFQRLHSEEEFEGTGIGLATVQRIIVRHGGEIWADAAIDRGATFYFTIQ